ncbi:helix-turn-helix domain-containing protein [Risungbinella massiliensis]|uniref:helix-turn-helix domain-containing protein n=1 Tax=Risungbinella massiliensis TaxID=1329796 RepID=UPI0005CB8705|nr:XRE family transcriptional regulator [Risungbinella massiliensis]
MNVGHVIRDIRKQKRITIAELCQATGLSKGFMSQIENNKTSPSLSTLHTIAVYLNVPLSYFLLDECERMEIVRKDKRTITYSGTNQNKIEQLTTKGPLRVIIVDIPVGGSSGDVPHAHQGRESHLVLSGKLEIQQGVDTAIVEVGDSFTWNASVPHMVRNIGDETGRLLIAVYTEGHFGDVFS